VAIVPEDSPFGLSTFPGSLRPTFGERRRLMATPPRRFFLAPR
jgi:hypothetical protein